MVGPMRVEKGAQPGVLPKRRADRILFRPLPLIVCLPGRGRCFPSCSLPIIPWLVKSFSPRKARKKD